MDLISVGSLQDSYFLGVVKHGNHVTFPAPGPSHKVGGRAMIPWAPSRSDHSIWHRQVTHRLLRDIEGQPHAFNDPS